MFKAQRYRTGLLLLLALFYLSSCSYQALFNPQDLPSGVSVQESRRSIILRPSSGSPAQTGLMFYPGGLVDSHVYNELLSNFVLLSNVCVLIVKMPANLAVFDADAGLSVLASCPDISEWVIAGHSLGGAMAASTVRRNPTAYKGLVFMDSYPADGDSLASWHGAVLSLYSSIEKVSDAQRMAKTLSLLPPASWLDSASSIYPIDRSSYTVLHQIEGGSHSFFGSYGPQDGDFTPTITRAAFHAEVIDYLLGFFTENGWL